MRLSHDLPSRLARLTFTGLLAFAWCGAGGDPAFGQAAPGPRRPVAAEPNALPDAVKIRKLREHLESVGRVTEIVRRETPRDTFDPAAVVASVGREPAVLL